MSRKGMKYPVPLLVLLLGLLASIPAFAGSAVIGSVAGSMNATVGGQALLPNTTLFSGDSLQVKDGVAVVAIGKASRMVFGRDTVASFLRDTNEVTVLLSEGNVSMFHPEDSVAVRVKAGDVSVRPATGFKSLGEVAMLNGAVTITAKEGSLLVDNNGQTVNVAKGKTVTISAKSARAPQGGAAKTGPHVSGATALQVGGVAASGVSVVTSSIALKRAGDARTSADTAASQAASAISAANAATAAAEAAGANADAAGCALNSFAVDTFGVPSPYTSPAGTAC